MRAIIVDDEQMAIENLRLKLSGDGRINEVEAFRSPIKALDYLKDNPVDIAFCDINMPIMDGLSMAKEIKEIQPDCAIVFVTGYSEYSVEAYRMHVSGYLMKPASAEDIKNEIDFALEMKENQPAYNETAKLRVQCFGNFEVFVDGRPADFKYSKTRELFAYLVSIKGRVATNDELCRVLWEGEEITMSKKSYFRNMVADLSNVLKSADAADAFSKQRSSMSLIPEKITCDYFSWLQGDQIAINAYRGEFMNQYSWSEFSLGEF